MPCYSQEGTHPSLVVPIQDHASQDTAVVKGRWHMRAEEGRPSEASHAKGVLLLLLKTKMIFLSEAEQRSGSWEQDG